jgi:excisionase family DNA binding protein
MASVQAPPLDFAAPAAPLRSGRTEREATALVAGSLPDARSTKGKAGSPGAISQELPACELERETGFEPATLSLGKATPCRPAGTSDAEAAANPGDHEAGPVQRSLPFAADRTPFVTRLLPGNEADGGLLTVREVAARLRVSTATVYKLCRRGVLRHVRVLNVLRIAPADLGRFASSGSERDDA